MGDDYLDTLFSYLEYPIDMLAGALKYLDSPVAIPEPPNVIPDPPKLFSGLEIETDSLLFHWSTLVSFVKTHDCALHLCIGLLMAMIILPVIKKVLNTMVMLFKWLCRKKMSVFKNKTQINMQMPEEYNEVNDIKDWLKQFDLFYKVNNVVDDDMKKELLISRFNQHT